MISKRSKRSKGMPCGETISSVPLQHKRKKNDSLDEITFRSSLFREIIFNAYNVSGVNNTIKKAIISNIIEMLLTATADSRDNSELKDYQRDLFGMFGHFRLVADEKLSLPRIWDLCEFL